jgi:hypothetical protein
LFSTLATSRVLRAICSASSASASEDHITGQRDYAVKGIHVDSQTAGIAVPQQLGFYLGRQVRILDLAQKAAPGVIGSVSGMHLRGIRTDLQLVIHFTNAVDTLRQLTCKVTLYFAIDRAAKCRYAVLNISVDFEGIQLTVESV